MTSQCNQISEIAHENTFKPFLFSLFEIRLLMQSLLMVQNMMMKESLSLNV